MEAAGAGDLLQLAPEPRHAVADQAAVGLDLRLARAAQEAEAAALALEVGPAADQPPRLIVEMCASSTCSRPSALAARSPKISRISPVRSITLAPSAVSRLRCWMADSDCVEDDEPGILHPYQRRHLLGLSRPNQRRRTRLAELERQFVDHNHADRRGKPLGLGQPRVRVARRIAAIGQDHDRAGAAGELVPIALETVRSILARRLFLGKVERLRGLDRRHRMLVHELRHALALEHHAE